MPKLLLYYFLTTTRPFRSWLRDYVGQWWQLLKQLARIKTNNEMKHRVQTNMFMFNRHVGNICIYVHTSKSNCAKMCKVHFQPKFRGLGNLVAAFRRSTFLMFPSHNTPACLVCDYNWFIICNVYSGFGIWNVCIVVNITIHWCSFYTSPSSIIFESCSLAIAPFQSLLVVDHPSRLEHLKTSDLKIIDTK